MGPTPAPSSTQKSTNTVYLRCLLFVISCNLLDSIKIIFSAKTPVYPGSSLISVAHKLAPAIRLYKD